VAAGKLKPKNTAQVDEGLLTRKRKGPPPRTTTNIQHRHTSSKMAQYQVVVNYPGKEAILVQLPKDAFIHQLREAASRMLAVPQSSFTITLKQEGPSLVLKEHMRLSEVANNLDTFVLVPNDNDGARLGALSSSGASPAPSAAPTSSKGRPLATAAAAATASLSGTLGSFFRRGSMKTVAAASGTETAAGTETPASSARPQIVTSTGVATATVAATPSGPTQPQVAALASAGAAGDSEEEENCSICLEPFGAGFEGFALTCHHAFHSTCIREWTESGNPSAKCCPLCRAPICIPSHEQARSMMDPRLTAQAAGVAMPAGATATVTSAPGAASTNSGGIPAKRLFVRPNVLVLNPELCLPESMRTTAVVLSDLKPPTLDQVAAHLAEVRKSVTASSEYRRMVKMIDDFRKSAYGQTLQAAGKHAVAVSADLGRQAFDSLVTSNSFTKGVAAIAGYTPHQPTIRGTVLPGAATAAGAAGAGGAGGSSNSAASSASSLLLSPAAAAMAMAALSGAAATAASAASAAASTPSATAVTGDLMRCPRCQKVISAPAGAPVFKCPCGATLSR
jgi:Ring finger domain